MNGKPEPRHPISLAAGVLPDYGPVAQAEAAAAAGFDFAGIWVDPETWSRSTVAAVRSALGGLPVLDVEFIRLTPGPIPVSAWRVIEAGAELRARNVLVISSDPDPSATAHKLAELSDFAGERGLKVSLEFGIFTAVKSLEGALDIVAAAAPEVGLLFDPIHLDRAGVEPASLRQVPRSRLHYAQFCDAPAERPALDDMAAILRDALDLRRLPGDGALPLAEVVAELPPGLPLSVELRSEDLRRLAPHPIARARIVAEATRTWLAAAV